MIFLMNNILLGNLSIKHVCAPAKSITSIAESGKLLSVIYLSANSIAFFIDSLLYVTL